MRSRGLVPTLVVAGLLAAVVLTVPRAGPSSLMEDGDLNAASIGLDHAAMLAADPKKNAAFMRVFGSYVGSHRGDALKAAPAATTQLAQQRHSGRRAQAQDRDSRLASEMQAKLTAGSEEDEMMTPHFVAALNVANGNQMLASTNGDGANEKALKALSMTSPMAKARSHILPAKLREEFEFSKDKHQVNGNVVMSPNQAALRANPIGSSNTQALSAVPKAAQNSAAASADDKLLASAPEGLSTKQLIQQAALRQMDTLSSSSPSSAAHVHNLPAHKVSLQSPMRGQGAYTQQMYQQPQYQSPMYQPPPQPYAYAQPPSYLQQQLYKGYAPTWPESGYRPPNAPQQAGSWYPAQQPAAYGQEVPQRLAGYQAPAGQAYPPQAYPPQYAAPAQEQQLAYQPPARTRMAYQYPPARQGAQAPAQTQGLSIASTGGGGSSTASAPIMSASAVGKAAANAAAPDWRSPDATIKGKGGLASKKAQMEALRTQILSDYKANTRDAEKALLMGPGLNR